MNRRSFSLFLALRYLKPRRTFLSIITLISVLGVTLGIMVMIVVISVMTGFDLELKRKIVGFDAHLVILKQDGILDEWRELLPAVEKTPEVVAVAPFVFGPIVVEIQKEGYGKRLAPKVRAVEPEAESRVSDIAASIVDGKFTLEGNSAVIGKELARTLGAQVGDKLTLYSPGNLNELMSKLDALEKKGGADREQIADIKQIVSPIEVTITGIFSSGRYLYDSEIIFIPLFLGQELYTLGDGVHGLAVKTVEPYRAGEVKAALEKQFPGSIEVQTWMEQNAQLFTTIRVERLTLGIIVFIVMIVAAFCVMNTLITVTVLKTREIGIMKAIGADVGQIVRVFLAQGVVVGIFGVVTGLAAGLGVLAVRNPFKDWLASTLGIELFPRSIYGLAEIPSRTVPGDVAIICVSAFLICTLAALIPAYFAARLDPVKALRFE